MILSPMRDRCTRHAGKLVQGERSARARVVAAATGAQCVVLVGLYKRRRATPSRVGDDVSEPGQFIPKWKSQSSNATCP